MSHTFILTHDFESMRETYKKNLNFLLCIYQKVLEDLNFKLLMNKNNLKSLTEEELINLNSNITQTKQRLKGLYRQQENINENMVNRLNNQLLNLD